MYDIDPRRRMLLISSSTIHGSGYLDHAAAELRDLLGAAQGVLFVPYALANHDAYAARAQERFARMNVTLTSIHAAPDPRRAILTAAAIFVGGGNTFRLLETLRRLDLIAAIRSRGEEGMPYIGSSAGSNIAGPTIKTTNDMPIVDVTSLSSLGLVPFQINPHYLDPDPTSTHMGETRAERIAQFHEESAVPVVALREPSMLRIDGGEVFVRGAGSARLFRRGQPAVDVPPGARLTVED